MLNPGAPRPNLSSYQSTVAKLAMFAEDPLLKRAVPRLGADGQPGADGGSFGAVYRLDDPEDGRGWALKCFLRDEPDRCLRYERVGACLSSVHDSWRAEVHYVERGLFVEGAWWPVVLMEWVDGQRLTGWIDALFDDDPPDLKARFARAAREFTGAVYRMHRRGISHGDLQSGNVLIAPDGGFRFVDYDAMTVPGYQELPRHEDGHPDFRLPREDEQGAGNGTGTAGRGSLIRTGTFIADSAPAGGRLPSQDGAAAMHRDRFPSHVIHTSLVMLSEAPELWAELHRAGADHLLLSRTDLRNPSESQRWKRLLWHPNPRVQRTAKRLCGMLGSPADALPDLEPSAEVDAPQPFLRAMGWRPETERRIHQRPLLDLDALATTRRLASAAASPGAAEPNPDDGHVPDSPRLPGPAREPEPAGLPGPAREPEPAGLHGPAREPEPEPAGLHGPAAEPAPAPSHEPTPRHEPMVSPEPPPEPLPQPVPQFRPVHPWRPGPYEPAVRTDRGPGRGGAAVPAPPPYPLRLPTGPTRLPTVPVRQPAVRGGRDTGRRRRLRNRSLAVVAAVVIAVGGVNGKWPETPLVGVDWLQEHLFDESAGSKGDGQD